MRILHVVPTYLPARRYGGPIVAVHGLCRALAARGHDVEVATTNVDGDGVSDVPLDRAVDLDRVRVHYFSTRFDRLYWSPALHRFLASNVARFDILHLHSVFLDPTRAAARRAQHARVPYVIAPRGMLVPELIRGKSRIAKTAWLRLVERKNFAHAAAVHFTSVREWEDARAIGIPLPSPFVVANGIDLPPLTSTVRDDSTILYLGRISWKKGIDVAIEALRDVAGARLVIAGNDEEGLTPQLRELAAHSGVASRVEFAGPVEGETKNMLLARATAFVLPSMNENFGNTVLEAMAAATPVIVSPQVGLAEEVHRTGAGIVAARGPAAVAEAFSQLLANPAGREAMGAAGRRAVEERFTWPAIARQMEEAYGRLLH